MTIFQFINQKLDTIKFSNKTKILIFITLSGTMTIGFLMFISIFALKYDYETLFQKHTQPQFELEEIKDAYRVNINETLYDIKFGQISNNDAIEVIFLSQQIIAKQWQNYQAFTTGYIGGLPSFASKWLGFFLVSPALPEKTIFQQGLVEKANTKMKSIDTQINTIVELLIVIVTGLMEPHLISCNSDGNVITCAINDFFCLRSSQSPQLTRTVQHNNSPKNIFDSRFIYNNLTYEYSPSILIDLRYSICYSQIK